MPRNQHHLVVVAAQECNYIKDARRSIVAKRAAAAAPHDLVNANSVPDKAGMLNGEETAHAGLTCWVPKSTYIQCLVTAKTVKLLPQLQSLCRKMQESICSACPEGSNSKEAASHF
jgi:hypothetical protein